MERLLKDKATAIFGKVKTYLANSLSKVKKSKNIIKNLTTQIAIALDVWTDPGLKNSYLAITGHFIADDFSYKKVNHKLDFPTIL